MHSLVQTAGGMGARKLGDGSEEPLKGQGQLPILVSPAQYTVLVRDVPDPRTLSRWTLRLNWRSHHMCDKLSCMCGSSRSIQTRVINRAPAVRLQIANE